MKLRVGVCSIIPDGGDQVPSDFLAMRMPEPPEPVIQRPLLMHVKTAIPAAFCMIRFGIFLVVCAEIWVPSEEEGLLGGSSSDGAR